MASKRGEEDETRAPREWGAFSHVRDAGSKPIASIVLPNVPPVSDTSNLARSTIRRVILVNESLSAAWISTLNLFTVQLFSSGIRYARPSISSISTLNFYPGRAKPLGSDSIRIPSPKLNG